MHRPFNSKRATGDSAQVIRFDNKHRYLSSLSTYTFYPPQMNRRVHRKHVILYVTFPPNTYLRPTSPWSGGRRKILCTKMTAWTERDWQAMYWSVKDPKMAWYKLAQETTFWKALGRLDLRSKDCCWLPDIPVLSFRLATHLGNNQPLSRLYPKAIMAKTSLVDSYAKKI